MAEYPKGELSADAVRTTTKNHFLTSPKIWVKGMAVSRDLVKWIADYGKILNFTVLKPIVGENLKAAFAVLCIHQL